MRLLFSCGLLHDSHDLQPSSSPRSFSVHSCCPLLRTNQAVGAAADLAPIASAQRIGARLRAKALYVFNSAPFVANIQGGNLPAQNAIRFWSVRLAPRVHNRGSCKVHAGS